MSLFQHEIYMNRPFLKIPFLFFEVLTKVSNVPGSLQKKSTEICTCNSLTAFSKSTLCVFSMHIIPFMSFKIMFTICQLYYTN